MELSIPRVRDSSYVPSLLEPRRRAERALSAVVQEAYVHGISTRKVNELVKALGMTGISKSLMSLSSARSRVCLPTRTVNSAPRHLVSRVTSLTGALQNVVASLAIASDATYLQSRQDGRVAATAVVIAVGVNGDTGEREVSGLDVGPSEDGSFWLTFLRSLVSRGLKGVRLVTSDVHRGLKGAIEAVLQGASWQRCTVHFMRNALSLVLKATQQMVGATIRTVFAQPDVQSAHHQWRRVVDGFRGRFPKNSPASWRRLRKTSWHTPPSQWSIGRRSGRTTRSSG